MHKAGQKRRESVILVYAETQNTQSRQKSLYRVQNWAEYDKALVERGSITVWMSDDFEKTWCYTGSSKRGGQFDYSEQAIKIMLTVKNVFHLSNHAAELFLFGTLVGNHQRLLIDRFAFHRYNSHM